MRLDHAIRVDRLDPAALVRAAMLVEIPPGDAVLRRHHDRLRAIQRPHRRGDRGQAMGLDGDNHHILRAGRAHIAGRQRRARQLGRAIRALKRQAALLDRLEMCPARDQRDMLAGQRQPRAQVAADRAGARRCIFMHTSCLSCKLQVANNAVHAKAIIRSGTLSFVAVGYVSPCWAKQIDRIDRQVPCCRRLCCFDK